MVSAEPLGPFMLLRFPYHAELVEALKSELPSHARRWDSERHAWRVTSEWYEAALDVLEEFGFNCDALPAPRQRQQAPPPRSATPPPLSERARAAAELGVREDAPAEVVAAAYRAMAKLRHPDTGGNVAAMQRINAAYRTLGGR